MIYGSQLLHPGDEVRVGEVEVYLGIDRGIGEVKPWGMAEIRTRLLMIWWESWYVVVVGWEMEGKADKDLGYAPAPCPVLHLFLEMRLHEQQKIKRHWEMNARVIGSGTDNSS